MSEKEKPGTHTSLVTNHFSQEELDIIHSALAREFFVTHGGSTVNVGYSAKYKYLLIKPSTTYTDLFNLQNEIIVLFSQFDEFDSRELIAIEKAATHYPKKRLERICSLVISRDIEVVRKAQELRKKDHESQVIIPFTYEELLEKRHEDDQFIKNRFRSQFYSHDLFAAHSPLKKDMYFFGRSDLIHSIANRHRSNENSALFGLRRTGKTSVIYGIMRALTTMDARYVLIDCQNPSFHRRRWNDALYFLISETKNQNQLSIQTTPQERYTETDAAQFFQQDILAIWHALNENNILIILDEIENITFNISPSKHWSTDLDFIYFWQSLRSVLQRYERVFSYLIVGTNPTCVEHASIHGKDNPIFSQVPFFSYIEPFDIAQTRDMVTSLGRMMGLKFDERLFSKMNEDYGGHPFLIRSVCSIIHNLAPTDRPTRIDINLYNDAQKKLNDNYGHYFDMVVNVLKEFYNDEYSMMEFLALDDKETFLEFSKLSSHYTAHLIGYGIIEKGARENDYNFRIEAIKKYVAAKKKYQRIGMKNSEKLAEISERRNRLEHQLRIIIRRSLAQMLGLTGATEAALDIMGEPRKSKLRALSYAELFDANKTEIYFEDLRKIINKHWKIFENIFEKNQSQFDNCMQSVNRFRADAHAKNIEDREFHQFRFNIEILERHVKDFL